MKKLATDAQQHATPGAHKDKQTLVLFLFGVVILLVAWGPATKPSAPVHYILRRQPDTEQWRVVKQMHRTTVDPREAKVAIAVQENIVSFDFCDANPGGDIPASFALFCNRPLPINRCRREDLEMLPGVGPRLSAAILQRLESKGPFAGPADLLDVPGIGPHNLQRMLPLVSFAP